MNRGLRQIAIFFQEFISFIFAFRFSVGSMLIYSKEK